jgi:poly-gamma-glutamate synthesis protein (capsule biosynthesis protein)
MLRLDLRTVVLLAVLATWLGSGCARSSSRATPPKRTKVTLAAVGDILLARGVGERIRRHGPFYPFGKTHHLISSADIAFFNLEGALSRRGIARRPDVVFRAHPKLARYVKKAGFSVASLANNHTLDYGRRALLDTKEALESAGIVAVGAGRNASLASRLRVVTRSGLKVGFLAFTDVPPAGVLPLAERPSVAGVDSGALPRQVREADRRCDVLVISFHWGVEYMKMPTRRQEKLARLAVDNGADLVLGHHPHVLQPVQIYDGKPVVFSMGGFVWDSRIRGADRSAIFFFELGRASAKLTRRVDVRIRRARPEIEADKAKTNADINSESRSAKAGRRSACD